VGNGTKQNFFKGRSPNGQKIHEKKMLTIATIKKCIIIKTIHLTPVRIAIIKTGVGKDVGEKEPWDTVSVNVS
jgi:hypothetical protein